jgi:hypothetical protein
MWRKSTDIFSKRSHHIDVALSNARKQLLAQEVREHLHNREVIKVILDCCGYLSRQALAFRGGDDDLNGNFRQLVNLLSRWIPFLKTWLTTAHLRPNRVTYLSGKSQNELISFLAVEVRNILTEQIRSSAVYTVLADTTPDVAHADQISLITDLISNRTCLSRFP